MNKIFIIGNGFDLAHGLPTSFNHFVDNFWSNIKKRYEKEFIRKLVFINPMHYGFLDFGDINSFEDFIRNIDEHSKEYSYKYDKEKFEYYTNNSRFHTIFKFENNFFKLINIQRNINNWVDIENMYYDELKKIIKLNSRKIKGKTETEEQLLNRKNKLVKDLNKEFEQIKKLFISYIREEVIDKYDFDDNFGSRFWKDYYDSLLPFSIHHDNMAKIFFEFTTNTDIEELKNLYHDQKEGSFFNTALFLCFNYTPTVQKYFTLMSDDKHEVKLNYIHNIINMKEENIIFGFGDEMDDDYKLIENINDNEYLNNFKSFQYLQYSEYDRLLGYLNYNRFQVCILGHSCGLSDRVLLNTIFEHENCRSIKVFYHETDNGDNYLDIIQNISRHFKRKSLMRERVVNKDFSSPMMQIQIPVKE